MATPAACVADLRGLARTARRLYRVHTVLVNPEASWRPQRSTDRGDAPREPYSTVTVSSNASPVLEAEGNESTTIRWSPVGRSLSSSTARFPPESGTSSEQAQLLSTHAFG